MPGELSGKSGPAVQYPGVAGSWSGWYTAVWPDPPTWKAVPSGRSRHGPISMEKLLSISDTGVCPALTQVPAEIRYFSA